MPHTNTIEALTLELDRVNEQKRVMLKALNDILDSDVSYFTNSLAEEAIQKAESR